MAKEALSVVGKHQTQRVLTVLDHVVITTVRIITIVIVAGAAGGTIRNQAPIACLRRIQVIFLVAGVAVSDVLRPDQVAPVVFSSAVSDDLVVGASGVNIVYQRFHIDRIAGVTVYRTRVMAGYAVINVRPRAPMELEAVVAGVAGVIVDDPALEQRRAANRYKIDNAV